MIKVAIYGKSQFSDSIVKFINSIYNPSALSLGGDSLVITATIKDERNFTVSAQEDYVISIAEYITLQKQGLIDALIIPIHHITFQSSILTDILESGLSLDNVYILKRLDSIQYDSPETVTNHIVPYLSAKYLPYLEYHVADKCNLNCVACEHYSGLVKEENFPDFATFRKEFYRMKELVDDIGMIRILGGEPLLNPELSSYIKLSRDLYPYARIYIVTNGLLVQQMPLSLINAINENNVTVDISYYPPMIDQISNIRNFLTQNHIRYNISQLNTEFTKKQTLTPASNSKQYYKCFQAHCNNLYQGKMASCFLPFTTKYFNLQYKTSLPEDEAISIMNNNLTSEELLWSLLQPIERCKYCTNPVPIKWDYIRNTNDLSNWLVEVPKTSREEAPLITIYTQCFNGEKYIEKCILSVINQSYTNFEYYVCNHGSTDGTQAIIDKYAALDSRIIPLYYPNDERGFYPDFIRSNAKGKYFAMLDSDDWWDISHLEKLVSFTEHYHLDMGLCGIKQYSEFDQHLSVLRKVDSEIVFNTAELDTYLPIIYNFLRTTWGKLIRMEMLQSADFSTYYKNAQTFISDDSAFSLACFEHCKRVGIIPDLLLTYRISGSSVTAKYKNTLIENNFNIYIQSQSLLKNMNAMTEDNILYILMVFLNSINYSLTMLFNSNMSIEEKYNELHRILEFPVMTTLLNDDNMKDQPFVKLILSWLNANRSAITDSLYSPLKDNYLCLRQD